MNMPLAKKITENRGFTLVEIIASMVIAGIIAAVATFGIVKATEGFMFTKQSVATAQKGQLTMTRLTKELNVIAEVNSASATSINFDSYKLGTKASHNVSWDGTGTNLLLDGDILTDSVNDFTLNFYESYTDTEPQTAWDANQRIIKISLTLKGADDIPATFTKRVMPRNLGK